MARWGVTTFSTTTALLRRDAAPDEIAERLVRAARAGTIEVDGFQQFRRFPDLDRDSATAFRRRAEQLGAAPTILGGYLDRRSRREGETDPAETAAYLERQLLSARAGGFFGLRLPMGVPLVILHLVRPIAERLGVALLQEMQGSMRPGSGVVPQQAEYLAELDSPAFGFVFDSSVAMPSLPPSYRAELQRLGLTPDQVDLLEVGWIAGDRAVGEQLADGLDREGHARVMMPFLRFGCSEVSRWAQYSNLVRAVHLKFWDLDAPDALRTVTLDTLRLFPDLDTCSEWGGHEWSEADGVGISARHLDLVRAWAGDSAVTSGCEGDAVC